MLSPSYTSTSAGAGSADISDPLLHVQDRKSANTAGGGSSAGVNTRDLNTVLTNEISGASLASNKITLPAGTYEIAARAPVYRADRHRVYLYNVSDSSEEIIGTSEYADNGAARLAHIHSFVFGRFTIAASKDLELRHEIETAVATNGLGRAANDGAGNVEVYADVIIRRVA